MPLTSVNNKAKIALLKTPFRFNQNESPFQLKRAPILP